MCIPLAQCNKSLPLMYYGPLERNGIDFGIDGMISSKDVHILLRLRQRVFHMPHPYSIEP